MDARIIDGLDQVSPDAWNALIGANFPFLEHDFLRTLESSRKQGLRRFLYHGYSHLTAAEFEVMRALCGDASRELPEGFQLPGGR